MSRTEQQPHRGGRDGHDEARPARNRPTLSLKENTMKTQFFATVLVATIGFVAAPSFAADNISGEVGYVPPAPVASSNYLTRAMEHCCLALA